MRRLSCLAALALTWVGCQTSLGVRQDAGPGLDATRAGEDADLRDASMLDGATPADAAEPRGPDAASPEDASLDAAPPGPEDDAWSAGDDAFVAPVPDAWSPPPVDAAVAADAFVAPACSPVAAPVRPATCPFDVEVVVWSAGGWNALADAIAAEPSDCAEYWITITSVSGDSTMLRPGEAARMHARGASLHAMAEFHYWDWDAHRIATGQSWTEIGHEFRRRMVEAGYCVESGDTWGINEAPSGARLDSPGVRDGLVELTRALYEGEPGMPPARGAVFVINFGHGSSTSSVYQSNLESWLTDATFWGQMNLHVRFWAQEVYTDPDVTCVPSSTRAARATRIQEFTMHPVRLAAAAPAGAGAGTAATYLQRAYTPLLNAYWGSTGAYGHTDVPLDTMQMLISEQIRATRLWADGHTSPDGRIGFAFGSSRSPTEWTTLGQRIARAIRGAYGRSATAEGACYEGASSVWCDCSVPGATFTSVWTGLGTW